MVESGILGLMDVRLNIFFKEKNSKSSRGKENWPPLFKIRRLLRRKLGFRKDLKPLVTKDSFRDREV